jgi:calcineurin-like phosphoesterase family protein
MNNYFSSDWHLSHNNILRYDERKFGSIEEHDRYIMKKAMELLKPGDNFYFLGDFCLGNRGNADGYLATLHSSGAKLFFIKGNHDKRDMIELYDKYGTYLGEQTKIKLPYNKEWVDVVLNHFAMRVWDKSHHGSLHFYGHNHDGLENDPWGKSCDVGIMTALRIKGDYTLFEFNELYDMLSKRTPRIFNHHGLKVRNFYDRQAEIKKSN